MTLTYGGIPLLYDYQNAAQSFMDRYQRMEDIIPELQPFNAHSWQKQANRSAGRSKHIGLPYYNWPNQPRPRINQMYWPTGATRYSYGLFLIGREQLTLLSKLTCSSGHVLKAQHPSRPATTPDAAGDMPLTLTFSDLYYLTPRRIGGCDSTSDLWLLPLVDRRYWWQFVDTGDLSDTLLENDDYCQPIAKLTWNELLIVLAAKVGFSYTADTVSVAYGKPDSFEFSRHYHKLLMFMDAVTASIGRRVVAHLDGTYSFQSSTDAYLELQDNWNATLELRGLDAQVAGTDCREMRQTHLPEKVRVVFPVSYCYHLSCYGDSYALEYDTSEAPCDKTGYVKTIHSTAVAEYECQCQHIANQDSNGQELEPINKYALQLLTARIAQDWEDWRRYSYDVTYNGVQHWHPNGFDDHILWSFGQECFDCYDITTGYATNRPGQAPDTGVAMETNYRREHQTRIQSLPLTCDIDSMFHHLPDSNVLPDTVLVKLSSCWTEDDECCPGESPSDPALWFKATGTVMFWCPETCEYKEHPDYDDIPIYSSVKDLCDESEAEQSSSGEEEETFCCEYAWARWNCEENRWQAEPYSPTSTEPQKLEELCAKETAERNVPYQCELFVWNPATARWCPGGGDVWAIDHRMGAPHAEEGWKGLYQKMECDMTVGEGETEETIDEIWVCVSLDCELPPEGCACTDGSS